MVDGGLAAVMSQTFRSMIHSRLELGMKQYERSYPNTAIVLIEPDHRDPQLYLANTFSYRQRHALVEHAYQQTRRHLRRHRLALERQLQPHGLSLDRLVLDDNGRHLVPPAQPAPAASRLAQALQRLHDSMDQLESHLPAHR
jgi:hypothetical protein